MRTAFYRPAIIALMIAMTAVFDSSAQYNFKLKYPNSSVYGGIEVGSKGVKMSVLEIGKNAQNTGAFNILKDTSVNTDFISFTDPSFNATLNGLCDLYQVATSQYNIPADHIYTVISSGVKVQAEKENNTALIRRFIDSFRLKANEPNRKVEVIDVMEEGRLSHLGIVPASRRYTTFLIDIGSGNTKGGYFPYGNTKDFKLFQLSWGTKSTANAAEKRCDEFDKTIANYYRQLDRVLDATEEQEIVYAINVSGAYKFYRI